MFSINYYSDNWMNWIFLRVDTFCKRDEFDRIVDFLKVEVAKRPLERDVVRDIYHYLMINTTETKIAHQVLEIYLDFNNLIARENHSQFAIPQFVLASNTLERIGEAVDQTACVSHLHKLGKIGNKLVLCIPPQIKIANKAILPYLGDVFEIVTEISSLQELSSVIHLAPYDTMYPYYSSKIFGHNNGFLKKIFPELEKNKIEVKPFKLKEETTAKAQPILRKKFGLESNDKFAVFHLREEGYFDRPHHAFRNRSVSAYLPAIKWLISQGLKVVRIGNASMTKIDKITGLIDLTQHELPDEVDIQLLAEADFYFGSSSGPFSVADQFGTPTLIFDELPYSVRTNSIAHLMKFSHKKTGKIQTVSQINNLMGLDTNAPKPYLLQGLEPIVLDATEILCVTKEMVGNLPKLTPNSRQLYGVPEDIECRFLGHLDESSLEILI